MVVPGHRSRCALASTGDALTCQRLPHRKRCRSPHRFAGGVRFAGCCPRACGGV